MGDRFGLQLYDAAPLQHGDAPKAIHPTSAPPLLSERNRQRVLRDFEAKERDLEDEVRLCEPPHIARILSLTRAARLHAKSLLLITPLLWSLVA